jgi:hypothetical protein
MPRRRRDVARLGFGAASLARATRRSSNLAMSVVGPERRKAMSTQMSAIRGTSGLVLLNLSSSHFDPFLARMNKNATRREPSVSYNSLGDGDNERAWPISTATRQRDSPTGIYATIPQGRFGVCTREPK